MTCGARVERSAVLGTGAITVCILDEGGDFEGFGDTGGNLLECHFDLYAEIGTAALATTSASAR